MAIETYANNFKTLLSGNGGSIGTGTTSINIASGTGAPSGHARFVINNEIIIGSISGTVLTAATRGAEGTSAASHNDGAVVAHVLTAASLADTPGPMTTTGDITYLASGGVPTRLAIGTSSQVLTVTGGVPVWSAATGGFSNPMTTAGDIITGGASGAAGRLGIGSTGQVLTVTAGAPAWGDTSGIANPMTTAGDIIVGGVSGAANRLGIGTRVDAFHYQALTSAASGPTAQWTGDTAWTAPTLTNSFVNYSANNAGAFTDAGYMKDAMGFVHLKGLVNGGTTGSIFTLPTGYRPLKTWMFPTRYNNNTSESHNAARVANDGTIVPFASVGGATGAGYYFSLDGITFLAEN